MYMPRIHWVARGTGIPKDRDEVNRREVVVCECDGKLEFIMNQYSENKDKMYMSVGVMKDYKLKLRKLHTSHTLGVKINA
jgi:hypothetical protein